MQNTMELPPPVSALEDSPPPSTGEFISQPDSPNPQMFRLLSDTFENVVPRDRTGLGFDGWPAMLNRADAGLEIGKALRVVVSILQYLQGKSLATLVPATKVLADGSRYGKLDVTVSEVF